LSRPDLVEQIAGLERPGRYQCHEPFI